MSKHTVRTNHWLDGILRIEEQIFESMEHATRYIENTNHHGAKIVDEEGQVVHQIGAVEVNTYA